MRWRTPLLIVSIVAIIISPSEGYPLGPANVRLLDIAISFLILASVLETSRFKIPPGVLELSIPLLLLALYSILILPIQPYSSLNSVIDVIEIIELLLFFFVLSHHLGKVEQSDLELILRVIFLLTVLGSIIAIIFYFFSNSRFVSVPIIFGIPSFGIYYGVTYYLFRRDIVTILLTGIILVRILLANSRSVWITLPIPIFLLAMLHWRELSIQLDKKLLIRFSVFSSAIIIGVLSFLPSILNRFLSIIRGSQLLFARPVIYYSGFQIFLENPYGVGLGNHATAVQDYARSNEFDYPQWFIDLAQENTIDHMMWQFNNNIVGTHSDLFGFLVETGAIGVLFFILFWAIVLRHVIRSDPITSQIVLKVSILYVGFQSIINSQLLTGGGPVIVILLCLLIADERITGASNDLSNRTRHLSDNEN